MADYATHDTNGKTDRSTMRVTNEHSSGTTGMALIVGGLVVAVAVLGFIMLGGEAEPSSERAAENAAAAVENAAQETGAAIESAAEATGDAAASAAAEVESAAEGAAAAVDDAAENASGN